MNIRSTVRYIFVSQYDINKEYKDYLNTFTYSDNNLTEMGEY